MLVSCSKRVCSTNEIVTFPLCSSDRGKYAINRKMNASNSEVIENFRQPEHFAFLSRINAKLFCTNREIPSNARLLFIGSGFLEIQNTREYLNSMEKKKWNRENFDSRDEVKPFDCYEREIVIHRWWNYVWTISSDRRCNIIERNGVPNLLIAKARCSSCAHYTWRATGFPLNDVELSSISR